MPAAKLCFRQVTTENPFNNALLIASQLTGVDGGCGSMQFSDDDRFLAATGGGEVVCVWDMQTGLLATAFKCDKPCSVLLWGSRTPPDPIPLNQYPKPLNTPAPSLSDVTACRQALFPKQTVARSCPCTASSPSTMPVCACTS